MGFRFRRSFKIAPGLRVNLGKSGFSSLSLGGKGARLNFNGKRRAKATLGGGIIPGLSYEVPLGAKGGAKKASAGVQGRSGGVPQRSGSFAQTVFGFLILFVIVVVLLAIFRAR